MAKTGPLFVIGCLTLHLFGLFLFDAGMFPVKKTSGKFSSDSSIPSEPGLEGNASVSPQPLFGRLVVVLVDGIREDFVWNRRRPRMPFVRRLLDEGKAFGTVSLAQVPTVTLPRIKALLTGSVPTFSDVLFNFEQTPALQQDNLLGQLRRQEKHVVAYGDGVWGSLFPPFSSTFLRSGWVTSFFVSDYEFVDRNVTEFARAELNRNDWDVLILHYLGLDHIGHFAGPFSSLVSPKLLEMDSIVERVFDVMAHSDRKENRPLPSLLVVLGDHGTADFGSHGGASRAEVQTPVLFMSPAFKKELLAEHPTVAQVDVTPTLSALLGLPIPCDNMGRVIKPLFDWISKEVGWSWRRRLHVFLHNAHQLDTALSRSSYRSSRLEHFRTLLDGAKSLHRSWLADWLQAEESTTEASTTVDLQKRAAAVADAYDTVLEEGSSLLVASATYYDEHTMYAGLTLLLSSLLSLVSFSCARLLACTSGIFLLSCLLLALFTHVAVCSGLLLQPSSWLCTSGASSLVFSVLFVVGASLPVLLVSAVFKEVVLSHGFTTALRCWFDAAKISSALDRLLVGGFLVYLSSLAASSLVEEEHQTWYFLTTNLHVLLLVTCCRRSCTSIGKNRLSGSGQRFSSMQSRFGFFSDHAACLVALATDRLVRFWNQTGNKWIERPDIGDWFASDEHTVARSFLLLASLLLLSTLLSVREEARWRWTVLWLGFLFVFLYRAASGGVSFAGWKFALLSSDAVAEAQVVYGCVLVLVCGAVIRWQKTKLYSGLQSCWLLYDSYILLFSLLLRSHSLPVAVNLCLQQLFFHVFVWPSMKPWQVAVTAFWMGLADFYHQGNSNALSTLDLTAGYVGMRDYNPAVVFVLLTLATWAGPLTWLLVAYCHISNHDDRAMLQFLQAAGILQLAAVLVCSAVAMVMRDHLFVWTVFSPKQLYVTFQSLHVVPLLIAMATTLIFSHGQLKHRSE